MLYGSDITVKILVIDSHGQPVRWALMQRAARYYAAGKVVTELGENLFGMAGGVGDRRAQFVTSSIVMIRGRHRIPFGHASALPSTGCSCAIARFARIAQIALQKPI